MSGTRVKRRYRRPRTSTGLLVAFGFGPFVVLLILGGIAFLWSNVTKYRIVAESEKFRSFVVEADLHADHYRPSPARVSPKLLLWDETRNAIHRDQLRLPDDLRATSPSEVGMVAMIGNGCRVVPTGVGYAHTYGPSGYDVYLSCPLRLFNFREKTFSEIPVGTKIREAHGKYDEPNEESVLVLDQILKLPR